MDLTYGGLNAPNFPKIRRIMSAEIREDILFPKFRFRRVFAYYQIPLLVIGHKMQNFHMGMSEESGWGQDWMGGGWLGDIRGDTVSLTGKNLHKRGKIQYILLKFTDL